MKITQLKTSQFYSRFQADVTWIIKYHTLSSKEKDQSLNINLQRKVRACCENYCKDISLKIKGKSVLEEGEIFEIKRK